MSRDLRQMSYTASLSNITATSVCSSSACVDNTELYGSTTAVETCGRWINREPELGLFAVIHGQALEEQRAETRARAAADGVEDQKALQTRAVVRQLTNAIEGQVHDFLADRVVTAREVIRGVFLARDQLLGVEQLTVRPRAHLVDHRRLEIEKDASRHVLPGAGLGEERVERVIRRPDRLVARHLPTGDGNRSISQSLGSVNESGAIFGVARASRYSWTTRPNPRTSRPRIPTSIASIASRRARLSIDALRLDPVFEAVQLPARVPGLHAGLTDVNGDHLAHVARASLVRALRAVPRAVSSSVVVGERFEVAAATTRVEKCVASARPGRLSP